MGATIKAVTTTEGTPPFAFSEGALVECRAIMARYPEGKSKSGILPILHIAQAENNGWLSVNAMDAVAQVMGLQHIEVYEVASFYSMFNLRPVGTYVLDEARRFGYKPGEQIAIALDPAITELRVFNLGDGEAMSGLLVAGYRKAAAEATFLVFLLD